MRCTRRCEQTHSARTMANTCRAACTSTPSMMGSPPAGVLKSSSCKLSFVSRRPSAAVDDARRSRTSGGLPLAVQFPYSSYVRRVRVSLREAAVTSSSTTEAPRAGCQHVITRIRAMALNDICGCGRRWVRKGLLVASGRTRGSWAKQTAVGRDGHGRFDQRGKWAPVDVFSMVPYLQCIDTYTAKQRFDQNGFKPLQ